MRLRRRKTFELVFKGGGKTRIKALDVTISHKNGIVTELTLHGPKGWVKLVPEELVAVVQI